MEGREGGREQFISEADLIREAEAQRAATEVATTPETPRSEAETGPSTGSSERVTAEDLETEAEAAAAERQEKPEHETPDDARQETPEEPEAVKRAEAPEETQELKPGDGAAAALPLVEDKDARRRERNIQRLNDVTDPEQKMVAAQALLKEMLTEGDNPRAERVMEMLPNDMDKDTFRANAVRTLSWEHDLPQTARESIVKFAEGIENPDQKKEAMHQMVLARLGKEEIDALEYAKQRYVDPAVEATRERAAAGKKAAESFFERNRAWVDPREAAKVLLAAGLAIPTALGAGAGALRERTERQRNRLAAGGKGIGRKIGVGLLGYAMFWLWVAEKGLKSFYKRLRKYVPGFLQPLGDKLVSVGERPHSGGRR